MDLFFEEGVMPSILPDVYENLYGLVENQNDLTSEEIVKAQENAYGKQLLDTLYEDDESGVGNANDANSFFANSEQSKLCERIQIP